MKKDIKYDDIVTIKNIRKIYNRLRHTSKHKRKIVVFDMYYADNIVRIYDDLINRRYKHQMYNMFLIHEPKERLIMSEKLYDKVINQLFSDYALYPIIERNLLNCNVATRKGMGSRAAYDLIKKYINTLKFKGDKVYALKMDIHKYFPSINHEILKGKLRKLIKDNDIYDFCDNLIDSTDTCTPLKSYRTGYGLPIGNMSSQIFAIFYLSGMDHYIKEKLRAKYYLRYMDDFIILSCDKEELKKDVKLIKEYLKSLDLELNSKTCIVELHNGLDFLGFRYILNDKRLIIKPRKRTSYNMIRRIKRGKSTIENYNGYLKFSNVNIAKKIEKSIEKEREKEKEATSKAS